VHLAELVGHLLIAVAGVVDDDGEQALICFLIAESQASPPLRAL
jgi:hypothetical protein